MNIYSILIGVAIVLLVDIILFVRMIILAGRVLPDKVKKQYSFTTRLLSLISISLVQEGIAADHIAYFMKARKIYIFHVLLMIAAFVLFMVFLLMWKNAMLNQSI